MECGIDGCGGQGRWLLRRPSGGELYTCEPCRDELVAVSGYRLVLPTIAHDVTPGKGPAPEVRAARRNALGAILRGAILATGGLVAGAAAWYALQLAQQGYGVRGAVVVLFGAGYAAGAYALGQAWRNL